MIQDQKIYNLVKKSKELFLVGFKTLFCCEQISGSQPQSGAILAELDRCTGAFIPETWFAKNSEPIKQGIYRRKMPKLNEDDPSAGKLLNQVQPLEMTNARQIWIFRDFDEICGQITTNSSSLMNK